MPRRQLIALFICSLIPWTMGNGLIPLLPVYALELGASPQTAGYYLSFSYLAITLGYLLAGWLSDWLLRRKTTIIITGTLALPLCLWIGKANSLGELVVATSLLWFLGGIGLATLSILTGLFANPQERGRIFGIVGLSAGFGTIIGGLGAGMVVDRWGFSGLSFALLFMGSLWPLSALLLTDKKVITPDSEVEEAPALSGLGKSFYLLIIASLLTAVANFMGILGRSLVMNNLGFSSTAISSPAVVAALVTLPMPVLGGWLSDRYNRKYLMGVSYLIGMTGFLVLAFSTSLWHFWVSAFFASFFLGVSNSVGSAWTTDLVPTPILGRGLALLGSTGMFGGVIGFALAGVMLQDWGAFISFLVVMLLPLLSLVLLIPIRQVKVQQ